jgi:hypothetical protein
MMNVAVCTGYVVINKAKGFSKKVRGERAIAKEVANASVFPTPT